MSAKFNPDELLSVLIEIARSGARSHISQEYRRCIGSSAGSNADRSFLPLTAPSSPTEPSTPRTGTNVSVLHTEDKWWTAQDQDPNWINQWDHDDTYDNTDPKSWK